MILNFACEYTEELFHNGAASLPTLRRAPEYFRVNPEIVSAKTSDKEGALHSERLHLQITTTSRKAFPFLAGRSEIMNWRPAGALTNVADTDSLVLNLVCLWRKICSR